MSLEFNNSGEGIHALAEALLNNKTLTSLDLTANQARWFKVRAEEKAYRGMAVKVWRNDEVAR